MEQQLSAIHQTFHQCLCFGQWYATFEVHGVYFLKEPLPVGCTYNMLQPKLTQETNDIIICFKS